VWWVFVYDCYKFPTESNCESILKIGQYLVKFWARVRCLVFLTHGVYKIFSMYDCYQILLCNERNKSRKLTGRLKNISLSLSCVIFVYFGHISVILLLYSVPSVRLLTIVFISVFLGATENARHEIAAKSKNCCRKCEKVIYSYTVTFVILFFRVFSTLTFTVI